MIQQIQKYIPNNAVENLEDLINQHRFYLKIVNGRRSKRGDFRATTPLPTITINNNLSPEQFLITLVHEIAHLVTFKTHPKAKPHGTEWKNCFKHLMLPFLNTAVFNDELLRALAKHFINPKATTDSDPKLAALLYKTDKQNDNDKCFIFDLEAGTFFELNQRVFKILNKRRTRYECLEVSTNKKYLVGGNASVKIVKTKEN